MRTTKRVIFVILLLNGFFLSGQTLGQDNLSSAFRQSDFLLTSPGAMRYGLFGYENPAILNYAQDFNMLFTWADHEGRMRDFNRWGLFTSLYNLGFGMVHQKFAGGTLASYKTSVGFGSRKTSIGLSYGWTNGDMAGFNRTDMVTIGLLFRPVKYLSVGITGTTALTENSGQAYAELALRPFGNELLSLFGDYAIASTGGEAYKRSFWSAGAALEVVAGLRLTGRYFDSKAFSAGIEVGLANFSLNSQAHYDADQKYAYNTYGIRAGSYDRNLAREIFHHKDYLNLTLTEGIRYRRYRLFDNSSTLFDLIVQINAAKEDPAISGIAINASGLSAGREMLWELRERIKEFRKTGKKVIVFIERPDMEVYNFASIADKIVLDPQGSITMEGLIAGRTYLKGTLEKIGIGFDEWRFFKYKSAVEDFSRDRMSEADRKQRQQLVDGFYDLIKENVTSSRGITGDEFDDIVNNKGILIAQDALALRLVDTLGRWDSAGEILKKLEGRNTGLTGGSSLEKFNSPNDNHWGDYNYIAVVYALGECAMNSGINARSLIKDVEAVTNNPRIKAVVLRVDSPGGDGLASDYIAEALKKCMKKKPVIVSQGSVAASGGYWLSMYSDTIIAAPNTITGSIGVIGGWAYNTGLKEKLGVTTDYVKRGEHAELGFGATVPFIGLSLPDRNLTKEEYQRMEYVIKTMYRDFVSKVAQGRRMKGEYVDSIGQGRVWTGTAGLKNGLVDLLGGLNEAINVAKIKAGLDNDEDVRVLQYPEMPVFNWDFLQPKLFGFEIKESGVINNLRFRLEHNGQPLPMLPLEDMDLAIDK